MTAPPNQKKKVLAEPWNVSNREIKMITDNYNVKCDIRDCCCAQVLAEPWIH